MQGCIAAILLIFRMPFETVIAEAMEVDQEQNRCHRPGQRIGKDHGVNASVAWNVEQ